MVGIETKADFIEFQHGMTFGADNLGKKKEEKKTSNAALLWMKMAEARKNSQVKAGTIISHLLNNCKQIITTCLTSKRVRLWSRG